MVMRRDLTTSDAIWEEENMTDKNALFVLCDMLFFLENRVMFLVGDGLANDAMFQSVASQV